MVAGGRASRGNQSNPATLSRSHNRKLVYFSIGNCIRSLRAACPACKSLGWSEA